MILVIKTAVTGASSPLQSTAIIAGNNGGRWAVSVCASSARLKAPCVTRLRAKSKYSGESNCIHAPNFSQTDRMVRLSTKSGPRSWKDFAGSDICKMFVSVAVDLRILATTLTKHHEQIYFNS